MSSDMRPEILLIGGGVVDIPLRPVDAAVFSSPSHPLDCIRMCVGGDAVNESIIISRLGHRVALASKVGDDAAGRFICDTLTDAGVDTRFVIREAGLDTGINIVLVREDGERSFITNRNGSLRRLAARDVLPALQAPELAQVPVVSLASVFVSPMLTPGDTEQLFARIKSGGSILCADTTRPKNGETVDDIAGLLSHLDYFFPNYDEAVQLTGERSTEAIAARFLQKGVKNIVIKTGAQGCYIQNNRIRASIPAYAHTKCIDTTGAGDNFAAAFLCALLEGRSFPECARFANAAASVCVESVGATTGIQTRTIVDARDREMAQI